MKFAQRSLQLMSAILKIYGPVNLKRLLWDREFSGGKWNWIDHTAGDCVYPHLTRHLRNGNILDLVLGIRLTSCTRTRTRDTSASISPKRLWRKHGSEQRRPGASPGTPFTGEIFSSLRRRSSSM